MLLADRFLAKVVLPDHPDMCWGWSGAKFEFGYGAIHFQGNTAYAHRISWLLHHGPIPNGLHVLHSCDNPECSNPRHLFLGTNMDNVKDKVVKGRHYYGERHNWSKRTPAVVCEIRERYKAGESQSSIARALGMDSSLVSRIVKRRIWKQVC